MKRKITSVLIYPFPDTVRIQITREAEFNDISQGRIIRYYSARRVDKIKMYSLLRKVAELNKLITLRMAEYYAQS